MKQMENREYIIDLYEIYKELLTSRQRQYFEYYYYEDYSLSEIAENFGVSRQAVQTALQKCNDNLQRFEKALSVYRKKEERNRALDELMGLTRRASCFKEISQLAERLRG
ncbi:hypothetical protein JXR74_05485 [Candidatus Mcinerneyibacteriota bacterium]|nr:hypothetical protein [Candidatus Mcinerneyibacteriota bacterium]